MKAFQFIFLGSVLFLASCAGHKKVAKTPAHADKKETRQLRDFYAEKYSFTPPADFNAALYAGVKEWLGVPFKDNSCSKNGTDCSGFVSTIYKEVYGRTISRNSAAMYKETNRLDQKELQEGDLVFFRISNSSSINHVGIYLADRRFAHASTKLGVTINSLDESYYAKYYYASGRYR